MTTSSSLPRISEILPAIHLDNELALVELVASSIQRRVQWGAQANARMEAHFFMTCRLTFCMSTFRLNSGGNLVLLRSLASTPVAMIGSGLVGVLLRAPMWSTELLIVWWRKQKMW